MEEPHKGEEIKPAEEQEIQSVAPQQEIREEVEAKPREAKPGIISRSWESMKRFLIECKRVLKVTKKPNAEEFKTIVKISGAGILIIGFMGFVLHFIKEMIM